MAGIAWTGAMRGMTQAVQWLSALFVIRLLSPSDYGLVGMATAYLGLVKMLSEFGLGAAVIQHHDMTKSQIARLSGMSVIFATFFALVSIALSGSIAAFFGQPEVRKIIMVLSVTFLFAGLDVVPRSLLKRDLRFRHLAGVQASENLTYAVTTLVLAHLGFAYWSLVLGAVAGSLARMVVANVMRGHAIAWPSDLTTIRTELRFGWHVVAARFAIYVRHFADITIVGRVLGTQALGAYQVARMMANISVDRVTDLVSEVTPAVLAAARHDNASMRRYLRIVTEGIAFLSFPATFGMAIVADDFVRLVFGERWLATITPLRILAVAGALRSITPILSQVLIAKDEARLNMQFTVASAIVIPALLLFGTQWGVTGVAAGWLIGHPLVMIPTVQRHALRVVGMSLGEYLGSLRAAAVASAATVLVVIGVRAVMPHDWPLALRFGLEVGAGVAAYALFVFRAYRTRLSSFISLIRGRKRAAPQPVPSTPEM